VNVSRQYLPCLVVLMLSGGHNRQLLPTFYETSAFTVCEQWRSQTDRYRIVGC